MNLKLTLNRKFERNYVAFFFRTSRAKCWTATCRQSSEMRENFGFRAPKSLRVGGKRSPLDSLGQFWLNWALLSGFVHLYSVNEEGKEFGKFRRSAHDSSNMSWMEQRTKTAFIWSLTSYPQFLISGVFNFSVVHGCKRKRRKFRTSSFQSSFAGVVQVGKFATFH